MTIPQPIPPRFVARIPESYRLQIMGAARDEKKLNKLTDDLARMGIVRSGAARDGDLPFVTHEGVLEVMGHRLRCYRLSDGKAIVHEDDFYSFFAELGEPAASETRVLAIRT